MFVFDNAAPGFGEPFGIVEGADLSFAAVFDGNVVLVFVNEGFIFVDSDRFCPAGGRGILVLSLLAILKYRLEIPDKRR